MKPWVNRANEKLRQSLGPPGHELNELDWKQDITPNAERLAQHISAFANHPGGGFLVFGIKKTGELLGVDQKRVTQILDVLGNVARTNLNPAVRIDHLIMEMDTKKLLVAYIAESSEKPVYLKNGNIEDAFIRSGGQTRKVSRPELAQLLLNSRIPRYEELDAITADTSAHLLNMLELEKLYSLQQRTYPSTEEKVVGDLVGQKIIKNNGHNWSLTNLGVLICAKDMRQFPEHQRRGIRIITYKGTSRIETLKEVEGKKGYAVGFVEIIKYISGLLPSNEVIENALRKTVTVYPEITIREILANALIHQDLSITSSGPIVEIFSDRMEITNPGKLLPNVQVERLIDNAPESRNEVLARFMRQVGICEERGSGIDKALFAIEVYGLPPVNFVETDHSFKVTIYSPRKYRDMSLEERIRACYQHCCLKYVANTKMTNSTLRERLGIEESNYPMVSKIISEAIKAGKLKKANPDISSKKYVNYIPYWA